MRRVVGLVLIGLGVAALVIAPLLRFVVAPAMIKAPLDQYSVTVSQADDATYLNLGELRVEEGRTMVATRTVKGDAPAGDGDTAVYDVFVKVMDPELPGSGEDQLVTASTDRVAFDRRTSEAVNCCGEAVNGEPVEHEGIEYKFPFDAEQRTYQYFDINIGEATDMEFVAEEELEGLTVYKYEQVVNPTRIAELDVPGTLLGDAEGTVEVGRYYSVVRTVWVEPTTGMILKGQEQQYSTLRDDTGRDRLVITDADLVFTDETVAEQAEVAKGNIRDASLVTTWGPLAALVLGLVLIGLGVVLVRVPRDPGRRTAAQDREPAYA
ncbi:PorA family protein [Thalassiella azotivora]